jgi:UDP-2,4-diacetamido-2,4,6-trideoxy-beta-L-altropyranose hydrolase
MDKSWPLLIRADGGKQAGAGHLMRCLALAREWQSQKGKCIFVTFCDEPRLLDFIQSGGIELVVLQQAYPHQDDLEQTLATLKSVLKGKPTALPLWAVLDGYHFDAAYQEALTGAGAKLLVIDDIAGLPWYDADVILNQNIETTRLSYNSRPTTRLLLGADYVLLRPEFHRWNTWTRDISDVPKKILVTMGATDSHNITSLAIQAIGRLHVQDLEARIIAGPANPRMREYKDLALQSRANISMAQSTNDMPEDMRWADLAIVAAGSTCWELAFMGLPALMIVTADNQFTVAETMESHGAAINLGWHHTVTVASLTGALGELMGSKALRSELSKKGRALIDGNGCERVVSCLRQESISLRSFAASDSRILWELNNDRSARAVSFNSHDITREEHERWISQRLEDPGFVQFIAMDAAGDTLGQIRFEISDAEATVSFTIETAHRGFGYGGILIKKGCEQLLQMRKVDSVHAYVKPDNKASIRCFYFAGFAAVGETWIKDQKALHYVWKESHI